jgi:hypothetical protein
VHGHHDFSIISYLSTHGKLLLFVVVVVDDDVTIVVAAAVY